MESEVEKQLQKELSKLQACFSEFSALQETVASNLPLKKIGGNGLAFSGSVMKIQSELQRLAKELQKVMKQLETRIKNLAPEMSEITDDKKEAL